MSVLEHDDLLDDDEPGPAAVEAPAADGSVWAQLRAEHARIGEDREPLILDVPGYSGLRIRYKFVELGQTEATTRKIQKVKSLTAQTLYSAIDTLILACDEILVTLPVGERPLADDGAPPVKFDHRLSEGMGWGQLPARKIVHKLFGGTKGEYQIIEQAQEVSAWIAGERPDVGEEFLGK